MLRPHQGVLQSRWSPYVRGVTAVEQVIGGPGAAAIGSGFNRSTQQLDEIAQLESGIATSSLVVR